MTQENLICPLCGGQLFYDSEDMARDVDCKYEGDDVALVKHLHCYTCGRDFHIFDPTAKEREELDYWNNSQIL